MLWLRPGQGTWSREDSAGVTEEVSDSELGCARSSEPVSGERERSHVEVRSLYHCIVKTMHFLKLTQFSVICFASRPPRKKIKLEYFASKENSRNYLRKMK